MDYFTRPGFDTQVVLVFEIVQLPVTKQINGNGKKMDFVLFNFSHSTKGAQAEGSPYRCVRNKIVGYILLPSMNACTSQANFRSHAKNGFKSTDCNSSLFILKTLYPNKLKN